MSPEETSLSQLTAQDWSIVQSRWARGIDWFVRRVGRKWQIVFPAPAFIGFPLYRTKTAAYDAATALILIESRVRARRRLLAAL